VDILHKNCEACTIGTCVNLCPTQYTPFVNLCLNFRTDRYNCGSFRNRCNATHQEAYKNTLVHNIMNVMEYSNR
jgi:hypothetical protein